MELQAVFFRLLPVLSALAVASLVEGILPLRQQSRRSVRYGIAGYDGPEHQSIGAVLWLPSRRAALQSLPDTGQGRASDAGDGHDRRSQA